MSDKPVIFISYSHKDEPEQARAGEEKWLTFVQRFLRPAVKDGRFEIWVDRHMEGGADWDPEIEKQLNECDVFVLLVSAYSMASDYVVDKEIAIIRKRQANDENVHFYPVVLTPTPKAGLNKVKDKNLRPRDATPLSRVPDRLQAMSDIADEIAEIVEKLAREKVGAAPQKSIAKSGVKIEIGGLPETPYVNLVGRGGQLKQLDAAWADEHVNVVSLVAEGGAGKSSLLNEWLVRLQQRAYADAEVVLGWSFYSQGSKDRATSAEGFLSWGVDQLGLTPVSNTASAKATAIAEALASRRILLALDGVEPLQHGPGSELGKLKDLGLRELLRRVAANPPCSRRGLIVLTTRTAVADIDRWRKTSAPVIELDKLSDIAGAELLKDNGVWGTAAQLKEAVEAFDGHALALSLVAGFLRETQNGDVRRRDHIKQIAHDDDDPRHAHARRVIQSYAEEWLATEPVLDAIMSLVGFFDRPAAAECLRALRRKPAITGLTDPIVSLTDDDWNRAVTRLRVARLLLPHDPREPYAIDAHPLVREWFGERSQKQDKTPWQTAHGRLFDHLRRSTREGDKPTLEVLEPLYQAIAHGSAAGRHKEALQSVYLKRICRYRRDGRIEYYSRNQLGAFGSDLAAISWFFERPYDQPVSSLPSETKAWVLGEAASCLRVVGRLTEAVEVYKHDILAAEATGDFEFISASASNFCDAWLSLGDINSARLYAEKAVQIGDQGKFMPRVTLARALLGYVLHQLGNDQEAKKCFEDAERLQKDWSKFSILYAAQGAYYCDLFLSERAWAAAHDRASHFLAQNPSWYSQLSYALDNLTLARSKLGSILEATQEKMIPSSEVNHARADFDRAVVGFRKAGLIDKIPKGLLAQTTLLRAIGDWRGVIRDLDEVEEIAEPGPMRLYLCDLALERARLAFAQIEAFAPLNGMLERDNPPKPEVPSPEKIEELRAEAAKQIEEASKLIEQCGYHRRDEELAELKDVRDGKRTFASLPPRV